MCAKSFDSFQYPQPRVYAMKQQLANMDWRSPEQLSVPSTSGLRDETGVHDPGVRGADNFQYPQPRVYAMKLGSPELLLGILNDFQYPQPRVYAMKRRSK